ncbi:hypothetical protein E2562_038835 [Oryza meyeriana var. granulata]|uniref:Uncharacterized protein n=1 Tax=Oryza meyeriana var. granulata TaxID=110450 RepID=A0A6G1CNQ3_9ORYZ|nr:hypothetical protein E2562_038835 [Oryza meyeriana var. granulata]
MGNPKDYCRSLPSPCDAEDCVSFPCTSSSKNLAKASIHSTTSATTDESKYHSLSNKLLKLHYVLQPRVVEFSVGAITHQNQP